MKKYYLVLAIILQLLLLSACNLNPQPALTPLEIQGLQTREYEESKDVLFPSVMSVFQDLGYIVRSADKDTGFITAESAAVSDTSSRIWSGVSNVSQTTATAFVEEIGKITRVRLNFVTSNTQSFGYGQSDRHDTPILDANVYQNAFDRIETEVFVRSSK